MVETERLSRRTFLRGAAIGGLGAIAASLGVVVTEGESPTQTEIDPQQFHDVKDDIFPQSTSQPVKEQPISRGEQVQRELANIEKTMGKYPTVFSGKKRDDVRRYYPIYRAVADKFGIDWYLLFITHEAETGASAGKRGFAEDSYYKGAMQLDPNVWSQAYIEKASKGLTYLANIPQRHEDDWMQIAAAGNILRDDIRVHKSYGKDEAVFFALKRYCALEQAEKRYKTYLKYESIFSPKRSKQVYPFVAQAGV